jgi:hypothetical protein
MPRTLICLFILTAAFAGCKSKVIGNLEVDGTPFEVRECRSGQAFGYPGLQLIDAGGRRMRIFANPDGTASAALFQSGADVGDRLGSCGRIKIETQNSQINSIHNVMGQVELYCTTREHRVSGSLEFENCH